MTGRHQRAARLGPARSATGRCFACNALAHRTELGWAHLGDEDAAACHRANLTETITFVPDHPPGTLPAFLITLVVCDAAAAAARWWVGVPALWSLAFGALLASIVYPGVRAGQSLRTTHTRGQHL